MPILEQFSNDYGALIFGWLYERVLYARYSRAITTELARRFGCIVGDVDAARYFCDSVSEKQLALPLHQTRAGYGAAWWVKASHCCTSSAPSIRLF